MSISGISPTGSAYNFNGVTNAQFLEQVRNLRHQGALTADQSVLMVLDASGGDSVPINGQPETTSQALSDTTKRDFISVFQTQADWMKSNSGSVGTNLVDSVLQALKSYQDKPIDNSSPSVTTQA
jgi:hypothetical protein